MLRFLAALGLVLAINLCAYGLAHAQGTDPEAAQTAPKAEAPILPAPLTESPTPIVAEDPGPLSQRPWFGLHVAAGFPNPAQLGLDFLNASETFGFSIRGGNIQRTIDSTDAKLTSLEAQFRYHPWGTAFFYGASVGRRSATVEKTEPVFGQPVKAFVEASSDYITPQVGWVWIFDNGVNIGFELGYLLPFNAKADFMSDADPAVTGDYRFQNLKNDVTRQGDYLAKQALPHFTLIRLGWSY